EGNLDVYVVYGHLDQISVAAGQHVAAGVQVAEAGSTGIALGPHLHLEVRVGENSYANAVNPALWLKPPDGTGTLALRLLTADRRTWDGAEVTLFRVDGSSRVWAGELATYQTAGGIQGDPAWGENGVLAGVPAGDYYVFAEVDGEEVGAEITIRAGETTFIELTTRE
ncbi:MAG: M23 family metallopeptidase, partial [Planctomycetes bacterium]|nr:M23 family metallopeptidase [Planctomycetota bacterium]